MTSISMLLVILSAFAHAFWNFLGKRRNSSAAFFLIATLAAALCLSPLLLIYQRALAAAPLQVWLLLIATGFFQAIYFTGLAGAYRFGQLSVAYPLARAMPVLLVTLVSMLLGLGKPISPLGYAGLLVVVAGCLLVPLQNFRSLRLSNYLNLCCALALLAACGTAGYTIIDSEALRLLRTAPGVQLSAIESALVFIVLENTVTALWMAVYLAFSTRERAALGEILRSGWRYAAVTGLIITGTYMLVLAAMAYVTNISYLTAFRQLSIPIGAILGIVLQKEPAPAPKAAGILAVLAGLVMIGLA